VKNALEGFLVWIIPFLLPGLILWGILLSVGVSRIASHRIDSSGDGGSPDASAVPRLSDCRAVGIVSPSDCPPCFESVAGELQRLASKEGWRGKIILFVAGDSVGSSQFVRRMKRRFALAYPLLPIDADAEATLGGMSGNTTPVVVLFGREHVLERVIHIRPDTLIPFSLVVDSLLALDSTD